MKKHLKFIVLGFVTLAAGGAFYLQTSSQAVANDKVTVYLTRTCGCCKKWVSHLNDNGFKTDLVYVDNLNQVKVNQSIPSNLSSCHTAVVNGYKVEGHVPADAIKKLLAEKPQIDGIATPGMPMGSPGMEGPYKEAYDVISFGKNSEQKVFMSF